MSTGPNDWITPHVPDEGEDCLREKLQLHGTEFEGCREGSTGSTSQSCEVQGSLK